jgi:transposase
LFDHWPDRCTCGHVFGEQERDSAGVPARHQVAELPPLAVEINEHRLQRLCCPYCGRTVRGELPAAVPRGCFGPKLEAAIASLTVRNRLSRRQLVELLEELFGCPIAVGTIDATSAALPRRSSRSTRSCSSRRGRRERSTLTRRAGT